MNKTPRCMMAIAELRMEEAREPAAVVALASFYGAPAGDDGEPEPAGEMGLFQARSMFEAIAACSRAGATHPRSSTPETRPCAGGQWVEARAEARQPEWVRSGKASGIVVCRELAFDEAWAAAEPALWLESARRWEIDGWGAPLACFVDVLDPRRWRELRSPVQEDRDEPAPEPEGPERAARLLAWAKRADLLWGSKNASRAMAKAAPAWIARWESEAIEERLGAARAKPGSLRI